MGASADADPGAGGPIFGETELQAIFGPFAGCVHIALAVSGGPDSTALLLLARRWIDTLAQGAPRITVLTVDHDLRQKSAAEASWVARLAGRIGFVHDTLLWKGQKPKTGVQAAARAARYDLMTGFCRERGFAALATAHTLDDQAETFVMRLARGSGVDGLAAMAAKSQRDGIDLLRPLLGVTRARLIEFLKAEGQDWIEDPSNRDRTYERARVREALHVAENLGLTREMLALSAARLGRVREALETVTTQFLAANLTMHPEGFGELSLKALLDTPEEIALRALARMVLAFGGQPAPTQLAKIEAAYEKLRKRPRTMTFGGCQFGLHRDRLTISREFGRMDLSAAELSPGAALLWDKRFNVSLRPQTRKPAMVAPLGPEGLRTLTSAKGRLGPMPRAAALALPSLWRESTLCFVPFATFDEDEPPGWLKHAGAEFANRPLLYGQPRSGGDECEKMSN